MKTLTETVPFIFLISLPQPSSGQSQARANVIFDLCVWFEELVRRTVFYQCINDVCIIYHSIFIVAEVYRIFYLCLFDGTSFLLELEWL